MRVDRIEVVGVSAVISFLIAVIAQLWVITGLPDRLRAEMHTDRMLDLQQNNRILESERAERGQK